MKQVFAALILGLTATPAAAQDAPDIELWRLDCGTIELSDTAPFSDAHLYDGEARTMTDSCYLIRNADRYFLWDAGVPAALVGTSNTSGVFTISLEKSLVDQLAEMDVAADAISMVGVSHYHFDHIGQLPSFPSATLLINQNDWQMVNNQPEGAAFIDTSLFAPWLGEGASEVRGFAKDEDVFGDGTVIIKAMPGHTPGHSALLVRLPQSGDFLLSGDLYHFEEQVTNRGVPAFNTDRADTLASMARFDSMAKALDATVIIQHDPRHIDRLPAFPESAK